MFSIDLEGEVGHRLDGLAWPAQDRFPVNRSDARVRSVVWPDLVAAEYPVIVAGYSSIAQLIDLVADWSDRHSAGQVRVVLGTEPHPTERRDFTSSTAGFTEEVRRYWLQERGISLRQSARVVQTIDAIDTGRLAARSVHGSYPLHAKIYVGHAAVTVGSSNFSRAGLSDQVEANARFTHADEPGRHDEQVAIAHNYWQAGGPWTDELRALLEDLLQVVGWKEALARACANLLEGEWAERYLDAGTAERGRLWPSQRAGIAQALWVIREVGSVLVADATGSGKTRMGAHLVRAVWERLVTTGRIRRGLAVVVCPPAVEAIWDREGTVCRVPLRTVSHGQLSRPTAGAPSVDEEALAGAQILAVDEAHNFLNREATRTRQLRGGTAEHVLLFTATPINRGPADLLALVNLLGADNFEDATLAVLDRLARRRGREGGVLSPRERDDLRAEIARFTVRRTKTVLNDLVTREPDAYRHPETGRVCRYPAHDDRAYATGETSADADIARNIRSLARALTGIAGLDGPIAVPPGLRHRYTDQRWLDSRLGSTRGLAAHHVLDALRSSRAALVEHLSGTAAAVDHFGLHLAFKPTPTGDQIGKLRRLAEAGPPKVALGCEVPDWLRDPALWAAQCRAEAGRYEAIRDAAGGLSAGREDAKAALIADLAGTHDRVLAFDHHLITLAALDWHLRQHGVEAVVAVGGDTARRRHVERVLARAATGRAVALCSDALNEGLNLQGASVLVHLDLPTTMRAVEQRVGRVDRMDSPYDRIEVWWPDDGEAFATRANELLLRRSTESAELLGSNLSIPDLEANHDPTGGAVIDLQHEITRAQAPTEEPWDGIRDAFDQVRRLVAGPDAVIPPAEYEELRHSRHRVLARVSPLQTERPWVFLAVAGSSDGAPHWQFLDGPELRPVGDLDTICGHLRDELTAGPASHPLDGDAVALLDRALTIAADQEFALLPLRFRRALEQMDSVLSTWAATLRRSFDPADQGAARTLHRLAQLARPHSGAERPVDPYLVAERWLAIVAPTFEAHRQTHRSPTTVVLSTITPQLLEHPIPIDTLTDAFSDLPELAPLAERVTACILGITGPPGTTSDRTVAGSG